MASWKSAEGLINDHKAVVNLVHIVGGIVIWEVITSLSYDWNVLRKRRPYRWTIWIHVFSRITCIISLVFAVVHNDVSKRSGCQASSVVFLLFGFASVALASFIIVLRVIAIWEHDAAITVFSALLWLASVALNLRVPFLTHSSWYESIDACVITTGKALSVNVPVMLASDILLLLLMLVGLMRKPEAHTQGVCRFLYYQGIVWLIVAVVVEVPAVVLVALDLNGPLNLMMLPVALASLSICATRMYRTLSEYGSVTVYSSGTSGPELFYHPASENGVEC